MKDGGICANGNHLMCAINYITNNEKTQNGRLIGAINCLPDKAYEQMIETKISFHKTDKRQGYHIILSFKEGESNPDEVFEITEKFVKEYIGDKYEAVYAVHDNTDHLHSHIIFNSVSFLDGKKYRYERGDWEKIIQPITNRLCKEFGLSELEIEEETRAGKRSKNYEEWNEIRDGRFVWSDMIKRDINACILQAEDFEEFITLISSKGYEVKFGKHLALKPEGMKKFRRCDTLGADFSEESIIRRIENENISTCGNIKSVTEPKIVRCYVKRYKRAKLTGIQKKYYAKLYRIGKLKKQAYSKAWMYKDDIKRMNRLQNEYLFLVDNNIRSAQDLSNALTNLMEQRKDLGKAKSKLFRDRKKCESIFKIADDMEELNPANDAFMDGDTFFEEEHMEWTKLSDELISQGYSYDEVTALKSYYKEQIAGLRKNEAKVKADIKLVFGLLSDMTKEYQEVEKDHVRETDKNRIRDDGRKQPVR